MVVFVAAFVVTRVAVSAHKTHNKAVAQSGPTEPVSTLPGSSSGSPSAAAASSSTPATTAPTTSAPTTTAPTTTAPTTTAPTVSPKPSPKPTPAPTPTPFPVNPALANAAAAAADAFNDDNDDPVAQYGVAVYDRANHKLVLGRYGTTPMMSASVIKLYVIVDLLHQREQGTITLDADDINLIDRSLSGSDDNAMNSLWSTFNGMAALQQIIGLAGLHETSVPADPAQWGEAIISASDTVSIYRYLLAHLTAADRNLVLTALSKPTHYGLADGFDQYFGLLGPGVRPAYVAAKQGWLGYRPYRLLHTTGLVGSRDQYITVVLTRQSNAYDYPTVAANVTAATGALLKALGPAGTR
ncbi:MAG TPA: serine hydrolase [Mycobacteriales bacterium]|nr:serine hydrolase [Mycobacteriales bacterium]